MQKVSRCFLPCLHHLLVNIPSTAGSSDKDKPADQASEVQRPPIRPNAVARSRLEQEPNPFEQSFRDSHGPGRPGTSDRDTPPRGTDATSTRHNALPPLSSLTSPAAADPTQFPWLANQSLRSGPLSPAMLTGPQGANQSSTSNNLRSNEANADGGFESSSFRTGFTPGTGSGFTPGYNSFINSSLNSLPIPSPNTAAFLNSITNVTPLGESSEVAQAAAAAAAQAQGQTASNSSSASQTSQPATEQLQPPSAIPPHMQPHSHHPHPLSHAHSPANNHSAHPGQDTITPNTLNALTGVFGDMSRASAGAPGQNQFFAPSMSAHPGHPGHPGHPHTAHPGMPGVAGVPGVHGVPGHPGVQLPMGYVDYAQHNANAASQAANGLFLLSQAHQELSKREEAEGTPGSGIGGPTGRSTRGGKGANTPTPQTGSKRKSDGAARGNAKKGKKATGAAAAASIQAQKKGGSTSGSGNGSEDEEDGSDRKDQKFETEEEKRKNFLERNRQGKCYFFLFHFRIEWLTSCFGIK